MNLLGTAPTSKGGSGGSGGGGFGFMAKPDSDAFGFIQDEVKKRQPEKRL